MLTINSICKFRLLLSFEGYTNLGLVIEKKVNIYSTLNTMGNAGNLTFSMLAHDNVKEVKLIL